MLVKCRNRIILALTGTLLLCGCGSVVEGQEKRERNYKSI